MRTISCQKSVWYVSFVHTIQRRAPTISHPTDIKQKIIAAAEALVAEGNEQPTNTQIRERLGGGSLSHISPAMREWRASRQAEATAALEIPTELKQAIEAALGRVWITASRLATTSVAAVRQEAEQNVKDITAERDESLTEVSRLEKALAELQADRDRQSKVASEAQAALQRSERAKIQLDVDNSALRAQIDARNSDIEQLRADLGTARADHQALQRELVEIARRRD